MIDADQWLLAGDPAIRWQTLRALADAPAVDVAAARARVAREGLGARILDSQGADGPWHRDGLPDWLPTLFTLQLLRATGIDPADARVVAAIERLERGYVWDQEFCDTPDKTFFEGETEPCINGGILALGAYFGRPSHALAQRLLREQLADGGWNCEAPRSRVASYHSTICVLEGLLEYERATGSPSPIAGARRRGEAYLLERDLFKRRSTGAVADDAFLRFSYPPRYRYDILRALDYLRDAGAAFDERMREALEVVVAKRGTGGRYALDDTNAQVLAIAFDESVGEPSRWNTLRARRVERYFADGRR